LVGLLGIDQSTLFVSTGNIITQAELTKKLLAHAEINYPFLTDSKHVVALTSQNAFIMNLSKGNRRKCKASDDSILTLYLSSVESQSSGDRRPKMMANVRTIPNSVRKYFPDVWIYESLIVTNDMTVIDRTIPDSITSWIINGFSIHRDYGLAIGNTEQVTCFKYLFVEVEVPYSAKVGEQVDVNVIVHNYFEKDEKVTLNLIPNPAFQLIQGASEKILTVTSSNLLKVVFKIRITTSGDVHIHIKARADKKGDDILKIIKSEYPGRRVTNSKAKMIDEGTGVLSFQNPKNANKKDPKFEVSVSGNPLGWALDLSKEKP
jgi:uncharacterized protein YfaS (alpha-2-macroglobulin family)